MAGYFKYDTGVAGHISTFILFFSFGVCLQACLMSPIIRRHAWLAVRDDAHTMYLGTFGMCIYSNGERFCTPVKTGYGLAGLIRENISYPALSENYSTLTKGLVMIPVTAVLTFIGGIISASSNRCGFACASLFSLIAFISSATALIIEYTLFAYLSSDLSKHTKVHTSHGASHWLFTASTVLLLFCPIFGLWECCTARRRAARGGHYVPVDGHSVPLTKHAAPMGSHH